MYMIQSEIRRQVSPIPEPASAVTAAMWAGRIARLKCDWQTGKWKDANGNWVPRSLANGWTGLPIPPQTVTLNEARRDGKGSKTELTAWMENYMRSIQPYFDKILIPAAGWINTGTEPEALTWAANDIIVREAVSGFANVYAIDYLTETFDETFFTPNGRLVVHKFDAVAPDRSLHKLGAGFDVWTCFIKHTPDYWIPEQYIEYWPALPMSIRLGAESVIITEYELRGYETYAFTADGRKVLLHDPSGYKSPDWSLVTPSVPV